MITLPVCSSIGAGVWLVDPANNVELTRHFNALVFSEIKFTNSSDRGKAWIVKEIDLLAVWIVWALLWALSDISSIIA